MFADERPQDVRLCSFSCSVLDQLYRWCIHRAAEALKLVRITDGPSTDTRSLESLSEASNTHTGTTPAIDFFDQLELYRTDKTVHFKELHIKTGLPYSEMMRVPTPV